MHDAIGPFEATVQTFKIGYGSRSIPWRANSKPGNKPIQNLFYGKIPDPIPVQPRHDCRYREK